MPKKSAGSIDAVSEALGSLKASAKNMEDGLDDIKKSIDQVNAHLKTLNGTVAKHQERMVGCDDRFKAIEVSIKTSQNQKEENVKFWKKWKWGIIASFITAVIAAIIALVADRIIP